MGHDLLAALTFRSRHRRGHYNAVQRLFYAGVLVAVVFTVLTGLSIWKPVQPGAITRPFPFNACHSRDQVRTVDEAAWRLELFGMVADERPWSPRELRALPRRSRITRHICVEGWSAIGSRSGVPFSVFLRRIGADLRAKHVLAKCFDDFTSIDMAAALHPQTILALDRGNAALPPECGAALKIGMPTRLAYKNPRRVAAIGITDTCPGGQWENQGFGWFGGSRGKRRTL